MKKALINGRVFDGDELHSGMAVILQGNVISAIVSEFDIPDSIEARWDLDGHILAPGLIDIQVNGGGGLMFNDNPCVATIRVMAEAHRRYGTTGFLPTLISTDFEIMQRAIEAAGEAISAGVPGVLGIHLEGPFLNADKRGIHDVDRFCQLDETAFDLLTSLHDGCTLVTIAPELSSNTMISRLTDAGVLVFGGHSAATYEQAKEALQAGMRGFTHLFNAMSPFESRAPGMVGAALEDNNSWVGIIADGQHVHPGAFAVAVAAKRKGHSVLVTDAMATVGSDSKVFNFDGAEIKADNGACRTRDGLLAGSDLDMISAVRNTAHFAGLNPSEALRMASTYPAHALGLEYQLGYIRPCFKANFVEVYENLNLYRTWIEGEASE
jgi:N-acetylglucosamine-6-phosphate deacetylase